ncbi:MAG: enoyl-CoA hydratase, partial [Dehalococcoidia bacterium]|nr:enoyl-CoA hydratase [Dehalococcoidia bacterium]
AWLLPRLIGVQKALDLMWRGEIFDANKALEMGYLMKVVPHESLMAETRAYVQQLVDGPPIAIQLTKRLVYRSESLSFAEALEAAQAAMTIVQSTEDSLEGPAAFREKRKANFQGR